MLTPLNTMTDKKYLRDGVEKVCSLTIAGLQTSDSATYYCAYIRGSGASIGPGSAVRVKQPSDQTPSMKILVPFEEDEPKVIIVCLVDGVDQAPYWIISGHRQNGTTDVGVSDSSNSTSHFIRNQISVSVETWASGAPCTCVLETENQRLNRTVRGKTEMDAAATPCWQVEEFVVSKECAKCTPYESKSSSACSMTGYVEIIRCPKSKRDEYKSCRSAVMEEHLFWKFEGSMVGLTVIFAVLVVFRQRALDRLASEKVRKQIESI
ncbi:JTB protein, partial [Polypterus senegalus]